jgi:uncharacterized lipoprotein YajG
VIRLRLIVVALVALGLTVACSRTASEPAATVNGVVIPTQDVVDELNSIQANSDYLKVISSQYQQQGITVSGSAPGSYDAAFVAQVVRSDLLYSIIHEEVGRRHLTISDDCRNRGRDELFQQLGQSANAGEALYNKFDKKYQATLLRRNVEILALTSALANQQCGSPDDAKAYYDTHPADFSNLCLSIIALTDVTQADAIVQRAQSGEDFNALVQQFSADDTTKAKGGALNCFLPSTIQNATVRAQLEAMNVGDVIQIPAQGGVTIVKMTDKQLQAFADVEQQANELVTLAAGQPFRDWLQQAEKTAVVSIDPRYGTFDASTFQINPPSLDSGASTPPSSGTDQLPSTETDSVPSESS